MHLYSPSIAFIYINQTFRIPYIISTYIHTYFLILLINNIYLIISYIPIFLIYHIYYLLPHLSYICMFINFSLCLPCPFLHSIGTLHSTGQSLCHVVPHAEALGVPSGHSPCPGTAVPQGSDLQAVRASGKLLHGAQGLSTHHSRLQVSA